MVSESKISDENYAVVQGWMINQLNLKGNELLIYAIIYGFSQDGAGEFTGSLQYLVDFTNSSRRTVINCLNSLVEKNMLLKKDEIVDGVKCCRYRCKNCTGVVQKLHGGSANSAPNKQYTDNKDDILYIVNFLNEKTGRHYRHDNPSTQKHINARLAEKHTVKDFETVITKKCNEWLGTDFEKFLRPETLFSRTHFDDYLNQPESRGVKNGKATEFNTELFGRSG